MRGLFKVFTPQALTAALLLSKTSIIALYLSCEVFKLSSMCFCPF
ncbi:MAG: hypothetical protein QXR81_08560 [Candidatus Nezhaarchaeales archaeon]